VEVLRCAAICCLHEGARTALNVCMASASFRSLMNACIRAVRSASFPSGVILVSGAPHAYAARPRRHAECMVLKALR